MHLQAALNGARTDAEHPAIPRTPNELAVAARAAVDAGADVVHVHAFDADGVETLAPGPCAEALSAIRRLPRRSDLVDDFRGGRT